MDVLFIAKLTKPEGMSNKEFFGVWKDEAQAALQAKEAGIIKSIYKVAGRYEVIGVAGVESTDQIDEIVHSLPIWQQGCAHIVTDLQWIPLRPYENWAEQLEGLTSAG